MNIYPAIDLLQGQCVRLVQGDFNRSTIYNPDPLEVALRFQNQGASWIHIIDLDGAKIGERVNNKIIKEIKSKTNLNVQTGGGIRKKQDIITLLNLGVDRVIVGTYALQNKDELQELLRVYPNRIIVSIDSLDGYVTYNGWQQKTSVETISLCQELETIGVKTIVYTDISKDGMMSGPNFDHYHQIQTETNLNVIASGGVSTLSDVQALAQMKVEGTIIGKALYTNAFTLKEAITCSQEE